MDPPLALPGFLREPPRPGEYPGPPRARIHRLDPLGGTKPSCLDLAGLRVIGDFLSETEAKALLAEVECAPFRPAQSGKLKQHYGAKVNFNKKKVNASALAGLPGYAAWIERRLRQRLDSAALEPSGGSDPLLAKALEGYRTMDVFVLRYHERDQSNLDLHVDDTFAYGEAILDLSLESDSLMTFVRERFGEGGEREWECVRVALPARSLAVLYGSARFEWQHGVLAYDIRGQRTSITLRTLGEALRRTDEGRHVARVAEAALHRCELDGDYHRFPRHQASHS
jgi:alkylated DNA repair protein alkB family protein 4